MWEQRGGSAQHGASPPLWSGLLWHQTNTCAAHTHTHVFHHPAAEMGEYGGGYHISFWYYYVWVLTFTPCLPWKWVREEEHVDMEGGGGGGGGGRLWLVTTPLPSKWARATGRVCVCLCVLPPAPPLHRSSFSQHSTCHRPGCQGNLLCWWVHLCVNHHPAVMAKAGRVARVCVCVCVCVCVSVCLKTKSHNNTQQICGWHLFPPLFPE